MPTKRYKSKGTTFWAHKLGSKLAGPSNSLRQQEEDEPKIEQVLEGKLMVPPANGDPFDINEIMANPEAIIMELVRDNTSLYQIVFKQQRVVETLIESSTRGESEVQHRESVNLFLP